MLMIGIDGPDPWRKQYIVPQLSTAKSKISLLTFLRMVPPGIFSCKIFTFLCILNADEMTSKFFFSNKE